MKVGDLIIVNNTCDAGRFIGETGVVIGFPKPMINCHIVRVLLSGKIYVLRKTALDVLNETR